MPNYEQEAYGILRKEVFGGIDDFSLAHPELSKLSKSFRSSIAKRIIRNFWARRNEFVKHLRSHANRYDPKRACIDCKKIASLASGNYMLTDQLWLDLGYQEKDLACLICVKKRLKRGFKVTDFKNVPCNYYIFSLLERN